MDKYLPNIVGIGDFQKKAAHYLKKMKGKQESVLVSHNKPQAVLMSLERYEELRALENARLEEEDDILEIVAHGNEEFKQGLTRKAKSLKDFM